ncbi:MAG: Crp/Fnr family transcriptional regulator [Halanaerobiales bacterium]
MEIDLSSIELFTDFTEDHLNKLSKITHIRRYKKDDYIFVEGDKSDAFYIIRKGKVKIIKSSVDGKEKILKVMVAGDFLGEMGVIEDKPRSATGIAIAPLEVLAIEQEDFLNLIQENPIIALKIIVGLAKRLRRANKDIELLAFSDVETRLRELFKRMAEEVGSSGQMILNKITHHEIADHIGTSRETVTRLINKMVDKGLIEIDKDKIILLNLNRW